MLGKETLALQKPIARIHADASLKQRIISPAIHEPAKRFAPTGATRESEANNAYLPALPTRWLALNPAHDSMRKDRLVIDVPQPYHRGGSQILPHFWLAHHHGSPVAPPSQLFLFLSTTCQYDQSQPIVLHRVDHPSSKSRAEVLFLLSDGASGCGTEHGVEAFPRQ